MAATGTATINFGSFPGATETSVAVTGQTGILAGSKVEAWLSLDTATAEHTTDEHHAESANLVIVAGNIVAGTGFTIYVYVRNPTGDHCRADGNRLYGRFTLNWAWA